MSGRGNPTIGIFVGIIIENLVKLSVETVLRALENVIPLLYRFGRVEVYGIRVRIASASKTKCG